MPRAPKKCATDNCETRVRGKAYCPEHTPINWPTTQRTATAEHRAWRKRVLARAKGICQIRGPGCTYRALEADHIVPVAEGGDDSDANGQAVCVACHRAKSQAEAIRGRRRSQGGPPPSAPGESP